MLSKIVADNILIFSEKIKLISSESSRHMIHMKCWTLFLQKNTNKRMSAAVAISTAINS